jgi:multidrug resistance efflux pump
MVTHNKSIQLDRRWLRRFANTAFVVFLAGLALWSYWRYYMYTPWTRDGRVRAETVNLAPEVAGHVTELRVADNQFVHKGDVLFVVDPSDYKLSLAKAKAALETKRQDMLLRTTLAARRKAMSDEAISKEEQQLADTTAAVASAAFQEAKAAYDLAKLNLDRTVVRSPVNGYVTNLRLRVGDYAPVGQVKVTVIDSDSYWVNGYFEETKMPYIHVGDPATIALMGVDPTLSGHVESIGRGIADSNGKADTQGLPDVNPVFYWVRLAQRIPVRIHLDHVPDNLTLAAGMTCTININTQNHQ